MVQHRRLIINAGMSVVQVLAMGALLWLLYRFLLRAIGIEMLGVWSLTLATAVAARAGDLGFSASVVKYVATYLSRGESARAADIVETAVLSAAALTGLIAVLAFPLVHWLLGTLLQGEALTAARELLPYALAYLCLSSAAGVFQAALDGFQRMDIRSVLAICGETAHLALCYRLVPAHGLMGLAYARLLQTAVFMFVNWMALRRCLPELPRLPWRWRGDAFREMMSYGLNSQIVWAISLLHDPLTKSLLAGFGGTALIGYYEMATRLVNQLRSVILAANQALVPVIAGLQEHRPEATRQVYRESYQVMFYFGVPLFALLAAVLPIISELWIGHYERWFVLCGALMAAGWLGNLLSAPAYFVNLGTGELRWNTISHLALGILNLAAGWLLGRFWGGAGVVVANAVALIGSGAILLAAHHLRNDIPTRELFPARNLWLAIASGCVLPASAILYFRLRTAYGLWPVFGLIALTGSLLIILPAWLHPVRRRMSTWLLQARLRSA
ncbi:MAG TPA: lipopolysaccharide biosynthesis protein [Blastocatellia bacterium]|nr:lipopolysaccharide biosynthesis protein [Blastocatellia bacterium]